MSTVRRRLSKAKSNNSLSDDCGVCWEGRKEMMGMVEQRAGGYHDFINYVILLGSMGGVLLFLFGLNVESRMHCYELYILQTPRFASSL